jgi:hypothetical protein
MSEINWTNVIATLVDESNRILRSSAGENQESRHISIQSARILTSLAKALQQGLKKE